MHEAGRELKQGGHGDHWGCIFRDVEEGGLMELIRRVVEQDRRPRSFKKDGLVFHSSGDGLRCCVLVERGQLVSAYPEATGTHVWPIAVREVVPWANGLEGQLNGDCNGAAVSFFDTRFYANQHKYKLGETYHFQMGALAYTLGPADDLEAEMAGLDASGGAKISFKGACAYMPASAGNPDADVDDLWFRSPLGGEVTAVEFAGRRLRVYPITIAIPEHFEMNLDLYAAEHAQHPELAGVKPGDDMEGFLWLHGHLSDG